MWECMACGRRYHPRTYQVDTRCSITTTRICNLRWTGGSAPPSEVCR